ncbi:transcriptional regulator, TetR family [Jannaschia faecimaris]|uniref:Transcriptional regulator, TetR family n=1 Tax=Jannaschia faecimaris TaxID=1244108 RepID=A0A1H3U402_9RHOB|nr:TetR/AcrR family transcriptional regulator [Jannaschia faecimaris]SDZ56595.1 transcriptional regulator, TetR family [Jannaschia faecimaris]
MSSKIGDTETAARKRGRPRGFDEIEALEAAMRVFWAQGFEGASVDRLCRAMRMPRASLYQQFGTKEGLFLATLDHYGTQRIGPLIAALGPTGTLHDDLERFFDGVVRLATGEDGPTGCLITCALADAAGSNPVFRASLEQRCAQLEEPLAERIRTAQWESNPATSPETEAMLLVSVASGMMIRARAGATASELTRIARSAASRYAEPTAG